MNNRKVVVTGMGAVTSLGLNLKDTWDGIVNGRSGINLIRSFDTSDSITQIAAEVPDSFKEAAKELIPKRIISQMTKVAQFCYVSALEAVQDSGLNLDAVDKNRAAVIIGATNSGFFNGDDSSNYILKGMLNSFSAWISMNYGFKGPNYTVNTACASSAYAMSLGYDMIKNGEADIVVTGGTESMISKEGIAGFNELMALSENNNAVGKACRPFDKKRDGFVMGEGSGVLVLEDLESALKRNARIYCEFAGHALISESYNIVAPEKNGEGMARCMKKALENSNTLPEAIDYINAHGTSTYYNDMYETMAVKKVFEDRAPKIPFSSSKSMIGHTLGAAGAIEGIITVMGMYNSLIPPTINYSEPDPKCDLDYVPNKARNSVINGALSNSFAFGGHDATLVFKKI